MAAPLSITAAESSSLPRQLVLYLTALSVSLATCAFLLQWRGDLGPPYFGDYSFPAERNMSSKTSPVDCADLLGRSKEPSFPYYSWRPASGPGLSHNNLKICITGTTSAGLEQILPWILYHKIVGITQFFLFVEGEAASHNVSIVLESIPEVKLIYRTKELEEQQAKSRAWKEFWLYFYLYKPCNSELFVRQTLNTEMAIEMAREAGMDWIIHIDTDELLHPAGTKNYSVQELLSEVPQDVDGARFLNYESCVERNDIKEPFSEVSMFKRNPDHIFPDIFDKYFNYVLRGSARYYFLTYANGKSGARIQDGLRSGGAHDWHSYTNKYNETTFEEAAVLHYSYNKFSELTSRRNRCRCKPTREDAKRCFLLNFDVEAFIIASASTEEEMLDWYEEHVVWYDAELKAVLLRAGVFERINAPMVIIQGLKESGIFADVIASAWRKHELNRKS